MGSVVKKIGSVVSGAAKAVGNVVSKVASTAAKVVTSVIKNPLPVIETVALTAVGVPPIISGAAVSAANGGNIAQIATAALGSYAAGAAVNAATGQTISQIAASAAGATTQTVSTGVDAIMGAIKDSGVSPTTITAAGNVAGDYIGGLPGVIGGQGVFAPSVIDSGLPITSGSNYEQVSSILNNGLPSNPNAPNYSDVVPGSELGSQQLPQTINAIGTPGATQPTVAPLTITEQAMQALGIGGNQQSALGNLLNPSAASSSGGVNTALNNAALTSLLGSGGQALSSYLSGQAQADAAKQAAANQMAMFNTINNQLAPNRGAGYSALNQIRGMLPGQYTTYGETGQPTGQATGTDYLTRQFNPQDLYAGLAPNYQFMLQQGQQANQRAANLGGGLIGGNALQGLENYTQGNAQNAYQQAFNNFNTQRTGIYNTLAGIAGIGQNATNTSAQAGQNAVTAQGQLGVGAAAANAAGNTGAANAVAGGLQNYQNNQLLQAILAQNQNVAQRPA